MRRLMHALMLLLSATYASAQARPAPPRALAADAPNVEFEMMTWPEVKQALASGKTTALVYTGGTEQRGPQNIIAGHNYIGREVVKHIAEKLGNAIAMPVLPFTPAQADPENPGNIDLPAGTLAMVLENISEGAIANGFKNVEIGRAHV